MADHPADPSAPTTNVVETHTAYLFFVGDHVYKLKKAIDLGFLDHRTREARWRTCTDEVALNRRLAPDVYLGVLDIESDGAAVDHLVDMRRLPEDRRMTRCLERGDDLDDALRTIAHDVAALHLRTAPTPHHDTGARVDAVRQRWVDGFDLVRGAELPPTIRRAWDESEALVLRYLAGRGPLFDERIADGRIRDGHGDLQAQDIFVLDDGPRVLDCLEFDEDLRWGDGLSDVAFLAMDLERLGHPHLATRFLDLHRELTDDRWPATLAQHYLAYRAHIRAKVGIVRAAQRSHDIDDEVAALVEQSLGHLRQAQTHLVLVGGSPGTGKSTVAAGLGDHLGAVVLRTDEVRRRMGPDDDEGERYSPAAVTEVYRELLREAGDLLGRGEQVILDATWARGEHRDLAVALAGETTSDLIEIECTLPGPEAARRIRQRLAEGTDASEATPEVAALLAGHFEPWPTARPLSTDAAPHQVLGAAIATVGEQWDHRP